MLNLCLCFQGLAAFLKAIGYLIPLMDAEYANYYTREVMLILIREFQSPDEEMKKIVLKVVKQCCGTDGVESQYIKDEILPHFFKHFWNHRMALDRRNYRQVICNIMFTHHTQQTSPFVLVTNSYHLLLLKYHLCKNIQSHITVHRMSNSSIINIITGV